MNKYLARAAARHLTRAPPERAQGPDLGRGRLAVAVTRLDVCAPEHVLPLLLRARVPHCLRSGCVCGMVQSEHSGSFSSEVSFDGDAEDTHAELGRWLRKEGGSALEEQHVVESLNASPTHRPLPDPFASQQQAPAKPPVDEEPTMEELLAAEPASAWGARAWEELDGGLGVTIKRVNGVPHPLHPVPVSAEAEQQRMVVGHERDASSGRGNAMGGGSSHALALSR